MKIPYNNFVINNGMIVHNSYSFNKAHAAAYGMISYCCMWLKHYYPLQFLSASLSQEVDDMKVRELIKECTRLGITVDYPDINKSSVKFKADVKTNRILCGFSDIKGIGEKASAEIILNQPYIDIFDFLNKIKRRTVNIRVIKALVLSGSFDRWYKNRKYLFDNLDAIVNAKGKQQSAMASKINNESETYIDFNSEEKMRMVRSVLSIPTTQHPTIYYKDIVKEKFGHLKFEKIGEIQHDVDQHHKYAYGIIIDMKYNQIGDFDKGKVTEEELYQRKLKLAPQGSRYVNFDLEDSSGFHRFNINPVLYVRTRSIYELGIDTCCLVKYRVVKGVENMCYVEEIVSLDDVRNGKTDDISFRILNDHPIAKINFKKAKKFNILDIRNAKNKKVSIIICLVTDLKFYKIKTGIMAFVKLDDHKSFMDCVVWPDVIDKRTRKLLVRAFKLRKVMIIKVEKSVSVNKKQESKTTFFIKKVIKEYVSKK